MKTADATKSTYTPTPWEAGHQLGDGFSIVHEIAPNCGKLVCLATCHNTAGQPFYGFPLNDETAKANRDFIVEACNSHAALLAENDKMRAALESASALILTARAHFPKSMHHADRFQLELTCAAIGTALALNR